MVCGEYKDGEKKDKSCLYIYNADHELVKVIDERIFPGNRFYQYFGVICKDNNNVVVLVHEISETKLNWQMKLDMDSYYLLKLSYDQR